MLCAKIEVKGMLSLLLRSCLPLQVWTQVQPSKVLSKAGSRPCPAEPSFWWLLPFYLTFVHTLQCIWVPLSASYLCRANLQGTMGERRTRSFHTTCHVQRDYGSRMASSFISCKPNGYASTSLTLDQNLDAALAASAGTSNISSTLLSPASNRSHYSPVSMELDPTGVNNGSGIPCCPTAYTKDPAPKTIHSQPSITSVPPPLPLSSWLHNHHKDFHSPYIKTSMQGDVYNFLERPAGLKCFLYHFLVWVPVSFYT